MSDPNPHIDGVRLVAFADGELETSQAELIGRHLSGCSDCALRLDELRGALADYVWRFGEWKREAIPPRPWLELEPELQRIDRESARPARLAAFPVRRWLAVAASLLVAVILYRFWTGPGVNAAELLEKATQVAVPAAPERRILVRTRGESLIRPAKLSLTGESPAGEPSFARLEALFEEARFDWDDPLSARAFAAWRSGLKEKQDDVRVLAADSERRYRIRTTTPEGSLAEASLTLRARDLRPLEETLRFRNDEWVEIAEAAPGAAMPPRESVPPAQIGRLAPPPPIDETRAGPEEELRVIAALNRLGADLGEPVEVTREAARGRILVAGIGLDPLRQRQIRASLAGIPGVEVRFEEPQPVESTPSTGEVETPVSAAEPPLRDLLAEGLGPGQPVEPFIDRVLASSDAALSRAHAIANLAARFPPEVERAFTSPDRRLLAEILAGHRQALLNHAAKLERELSTFLPGAPRESSTGEPCRGWQECAAAGLRANQALDRALNQALAGARAEPPDRLAEQVRAALEVWLAAVGALDRSVTSSVP